MWIELTVNCVRPRWNMFDHIACHTFSSGDILLSINGVDLTQLTYNEAVSVLKAQTAQSQVVLRVIQTLSEESEEEAEANNDEMDTMDDLRDDSLNWTPLWTRWLGLPRYSQISLFTTSCLFCVKRLWSDPGLVVSVTCIGAGTSSCTRPTTRAGASVSSGVTRRATASSLSSSKPSCLVHPLTLTDASSRLTSVWPSAPTPCHHSDRSSPMLITCASPPGAAMRSWQWTEPQQWGWITRLSSQCWSCRRIKSHWLWCPGLAVWCRKTYLLKHTFTIFFFSLTQSFALSGCVLCWATHYHRFHM